MSGPPALGVGPVLPHLIDPRSAAPVDRPSTVVVSAPRAVLADALSTALAVADEASRAAILAAMPALGARAWLG